MKVIVIGIMGTGILVNSVSRIRAETGPDPLCLEMELTESMIMHNADAVVATDLASCVIPVIAACTVGEPGATETTGEKKDRTSLSFFTAERPITWGSLLSRRLWRRPRLSSFQL